MEPSKNNKPMMPMIGLSWEIKSRIKSRLGRYVGPVDEVFFPKEGNEVMEVIVR
jgi:hypothetical protein